MKILHIITGLGDGGAEAVLYRLITKNHQNQHYVVSLTDEDKYGPLLKQAGIVVFALNIPRGRLSIKGLIKLWHLLNDLQPDVVQTWMYHADLIGGLIARFRNYPVVWGLRHTMLKKGLVKNTTIWIARICGLLSRFIPKYIIACAKASSDVHIALGYDKNRMFLIPNGYDLSDFKPDSNLRQSLRKEWGIKDDIPILGMVARYHPIKDHANLINALSKLHKDGVKFKIVLVGSGIDHSNTKLIDIISKEGLINSVLLLGKRNDIPAIMNTIDIYVLSSMGEAFPNVIAEAMACGTPCVTTDVGDSAQIVGDTGWVVPPKNSEALALAIHMAIDAWKDRKSWTKRQLACRERIIKNYSIDIMVNRYCEVWSKAVKK